MYEVCGLEMISSHSTGYSLTLLLRAGSLAHIINTPTTKTRSAGARANADIAQPTRATGIENESAYSGRTGEKMLTPSIAQPETSERFRITSKRGFIYKRPIMCTLFSSLPIIVYHCIPGLAHEEKDRGIYQNMSDLVKKRLLPGISEIISCFATIFNRSIRLKPEDIAPA